MVGKPVPNQQNSNQADPDLHRRVAELLQDPRSYPENPAAVELCETHISLVHLGNHVVYKLKKPVKMDFLDFSTVARRKAACEDEVRLNRRLAPEVYLGLTPIVARDDGSLALGEMSAAEPRAVDWLVKMRRLSDEDTLRAKLEADAISATDLRAISERLSEFFTAQPPAPITWRQYVDGLDDHIRANRSVMLEHEKCLDEATTRQLHRIHAAQLIYLHTHQRLFRDRVSQGRVIDAHGDLRPDHVYLTPAPVFLDCIEFSQDFRTNDCLDEICFLAMECQRMGKSWVAEQLLEQYQLLQDDNEPSVRAGLIPFYQSYRACVRAKVALLRSDQVQGPDREHALAESTEYLDLAEQAIRTRPLLLVVRGVSGTGKSTVAAAIAERFACERLQTDQIRAQMTPPTDSAADASGHNEGRYSWEQRLRVYEAMFETAQQALERGESVILDATFLTHRLQQEALDLAARCQATPWIVNCTCPAATAQQRIAARIGCGGASFSEAQVETHVRQLAEQQLPLSAMPQHTVDTTLPVSDVVGQIIDQLPDLWNPAADDIDSE